MRFLLLGCWWAFKNYIFTGVRCVIHFWTGKVLSSCVGFTHMNPSSQPGADTVLTKLRRKSRSNWAPRSNGGLWPCSCFVCKWTLRAAYGQKANEWVCWPHSLYRNRLFIFFPVVALCKKQNFYAAALKLFGAVWKVWKNVHTAIHEQSFE